MSRQVILTAVAAVFLVPAALLADTWCNSSYPPTEESCHSAAVWCDDADRLCNGAPACPPPPPEACPLGSGFSWKIIRQHFPRTSQINDTGNLCGVEIRGEEVDNLISSPPMAVRSPYGDLGQATVDLTPDIQYTWGSNYNAVVGLDQEEYALKLRFNIGGGVSTATHIMYDSGVLELFLDTGVPNNNRAPMDYIMVGADNGAGCINCNSSCPPGQTSVMSGWPFVCQTYEASPAPFCPPLQTNVRTAIAVGVNALLDNNPCHCEKTSNKWPTNPYLSFYDGLKWRVLHPDHTGPAGENAVWTTNYSGPPVSPGAYFILGRKTNVVTMTVRSTTVDISMYAKQTNINGVNYEVTSTVTGLKREYLGKFNKLHVGSSIGCQLENDAYSCGGRNKHCLHATYDTCDGSPKAQWGAKFITLDNLALSGGWPDGVEGACCFDGTTCAVMPPADCIAAGGTSAGPNVPCDPLPCHGACCQSNGECADANFDACPGTFMGFGSNCQTAQCPCNHPFADTDGDNDVDMDDFGVFQRCIASVEAGLPEARCSCLDRDNSGNGDGDIDATDFTAFKNCVSGPGIPANPGC